MMEAPFYVYEHIRSDTGGIFHVGKGQGNRAYEMNASRNRFHKNIQRKLKRTGHSVIVRIAIKNIAIEADALKMEVGLIAIRKEQGHRLTNLTLGGEGTSGWVPTKKTRRKMSAANKEAWSRPEVKAKRSAAAKEANSRPEVKAKISAAQKIARR